MNTESHWVSLPLPVSIHFLLYLPLPFSLPLPFPFLLPFPLSLPIPFSFPLTFCFPVPFPFILPVLPLVLLVFVDLLLAEHLNSLWNIDLPYLLLACLLEMLCLLVPIEVKLEQVGLLAHLIQFQVYEDDPVPFVVILVVVELHVQVLCWLRLILQETDHDALHWLLVVGDVLYLIHPDHFQQLVLSAVPVHFQLVIHHHHQHLLEGGFVFYHLGEFLLGLGDTDLDIVPAVILDCELELPVQLGFLLLDVPFVVAPHYLVLHPDLLQDSSILPVVDVQPGLR